MPCYSPLKGYADEENGGIKFRREGEAINQEMEVACGQCLGCRLDRSRMWAARIVHESQMPEYGGNNAFVTLTYRDPVRCTRDQFEGGKYIPENWSLSVPRRENGRQIEQSHLQGFIRRLRKNRPGQKIKYFACGEYGRICKHGFDLSLQKCPLCKHGRPHYHAILFGVSFTDLFEYEGGDGTTRWSSHELEDTWQYGMTDLEEVTFNSAAYVASYILKKVNGDLAEEHYEQTTELGEIVKLEPEFAQMSNGIGKEWYEKYKNDLFPSDEVPVPGHGVMKKAPRYYVDLMRAEDPEAYEALKEKRMAYKEENPEEFDANRLYEKYRVKKAKTGNKQRL